MKYFDSHCHLQLPQFDADREDTIERMHERGVGGIVVGTDFKTSREAVELAETRDFLWAAVGLHPNDNLEEEFDIKNYNELAADPKVVAIGECGLDYFRSGSSEEERSAQKERFIVQIKLALAVKKTLIIHCRDNPKRKEGEPSAHADVQKILFSYSAELQNSSVAVVIHFFTGSSELAQQYIDLGCYLSFPGPVTYKGIAAPNSAASSPHDEASPAHGASDESIRVAPIDKILSETDSPFAAPVPHRGKRNEPVYVEEVVKKIAAVKNLPVEEVAAQIILNSQRIFNIV